MENAAKGLIMAGGILIAVIVLSVGVYIFTTFRDGTEPYNQNLTDQEIWAFNNKFLDCIDNNKVKLQDVMTMINLAIATENKEVPVLIIFKGKPYGCTSEGIIHGKGIDVIDELASEIELEIGSDNKLEYTVDEIQYYTASDSNPYIIGAIKQITID